FPIPVRKVGEKKQDEILEMTAGGSRVMCSDMATVLALLTAKTTETEQETVHPIPVVLVLDTDQKVYVWRESEHQAYTAGCRDNTPAGIIQDVSPALQSYLNNHSEVMAQATKVLTKNTFSVELPVSSIEAFGVEEYEKEMIDVVQRCVLQMNEVRERVEYLVDQNVPRKIIKGILNRLDWRAGVIKPRQLYLQNGGEDFLTRALGYYLANKNLLLVGEKGAGKNSLITSVCWVMNQSFCRIQGNAEVDKFDILGGQTLSENGTKFELSIFIQALRNGEDAILDEINSISSGIALMIHSLTDDAKSIDIPGYGRVEVHPRSHLWSTMNEGYVGTSIMNPGTVDRFTTLRLSTQIDMTELLRRMFPDTEQSEIKTCGQIYDRILKAVGNGDCTPDAITTRGYIDAIESAEWLPLRATLLDNVGNRSQDEMDRKVICDFICAAYPV
ncbi:MAG: AAA family ATPase, partial [Oscillospiraceae bacterium]|nr:AAA family ATPase [Oscillospiraceae bacterium]